MNVAQRSDLRSVTAIYDTRAAAREAEAWLRNVGVPAAGIRIVAAVATAAPAEAAAAPAKRKRGLMNALVDMIFPDEAEGAAGGGACLLTVSDLDPTLFDQVVGILSQGGKIRLESRRIDLGGAAQIKGMIGACLVDTDSGLMLASEGGAAPGRALDLPRVAALNSETVRAKQAAVEQVFRGQRIEDILITLEREVHLIRPLDRNRSMFVYVALDKASSNLGMARLQLKALESELAV